MKKFGCFLFLILLLAGGGWYGWDRFPRSMPEGTPTEWTLYGNVEIRRASLGFRVSGRITDIRFEEGNFVPQGEVLAVLDRAPFEANLAAAVARRDSAAAVLERLENGSRPQEIQEAKAQLEEYRAARTETEAEYDRLAKLVRTNAISDSEYDAAVAARDIAVARVRRAEEALSLLEEGPRKEEIAAARAQKAEAEANRLQAEIALSDTELRCPNDGVVLTRVAEPGAVVQASQTVLTLSLKNIVWVYVYVDEPNLGKIAPGQTVKIRTDSSDKAYDGTIGYISPEAEFTPKNVETPELRTNLVYRVRIVAQSPDDGLRQGMPVTVTMEPSR